MSGAGESKSHQQHFNHTTRFNDSDAVTWCGKRFDLN